MGREKNRANEIIEAESLSAGSPAAETKVEIERGTAGDCSGGFTECAREGFDAFEFRADGSGAVFPPIVLAMYMSIIFSQIVCYRKFCF
jgi:hypothetical protein